MTIEELNKANHIKDEIEWCTEVLNHICVNHKLGFRFDTTRDCIENHDYMGCPKWLLEVIEQAVRDYREQKGKEFEEI